MKRDTHLKQLRTLSENEYTGVHAFCPTRWTTRGETCKAMVDNHEELMQLWEFTGERSRY